MHSSAFIRKIRARISLDRYIAQRRTERMYKAEGERLRREYRDRGKVKLHFGCGPRILKGWINIDLSFEPYERYLQYYTDTYYPEAVRGGRADLYTMDITRTGLPLPDDSVDVIFHEDFLEHLNQKEQILFLAETFRVLKPGSVHRINTPDLLSSMRKHSDFTKGKEGVYEGEWDNHGHKHLVTARYIEEVAVMIGYREVVYNGRNKSISQDIPLEYRPGSDRPEEGNIFADLIK